MHRFLHLGDLHLGPNDRNVDRIAALDRVIKEGLQQPLAAWLWPGDLNHGRMTIPDKNILTGRVQIMANHAPVVICPGNHDLPGDLDFLAKLFAVHPIHVINQPEVIDIYTATGVDAAIFVLPYPQRAGLVATGVASDNIVDAARGALDLIFMDAAAKLAEARKAGMITMMIAHVNISGSRVSSGQPNVGREIEIDQSLLDRLGNIPKMFNHIHVAQEICGAYYAGSCCRLDFSEIDPKRYLTVEYESVDSYRIVSHPIDVAPMFHVDGELSRDGFRLAEFADAEVKRRYHAGDWTGAEVRCRFRFVAADKALLDFEAVKAPFAVAKRLELDPIAEHTRAIRAPEVAAAQTLDEKLHAIAKGAGIEWTAALTEKLALLQQAPDGAAFLSAIEDNLTVIDVDVPQEVCQ